MARPAPHYRAVSANKGEGMNEQDTWLDSMSTTMSKVVNILTGEECEVLVEGGSIFRAANLTKAGKRNLRKGPDGWLSGGIPDDRPMFTWTLFDADRETDANSLRLRLYELEAAARKARVALFAAYGQRCRKKE